jgi:hypothetical protein
MKMSNASGFQALAILMMVGCSLIGCATPDPPLPSKMPTRTFPVVEPTMEATATRNADQPVSATSHPALTSVAIDPALEPVPNSFPYGIVYAYSKSDWTESDRQAIREHLEYLNGLGVNTIVQVFSSRLIGTGRERDWLILLDEAEQINMRVIARLWPLQDWTGQGFDFQPIEAFLAVVQDHPALLAYLGLHEPLEVFDSDQLRDFYAGLKAIAPELPVAHLLGNMAWFDTSLRFSNRVFTAGICDICVVWYTPARYLDGEPFFEEDLFREIVRENRELVNERAPDAQLWVMGQTYTQLQHRHQLRMPTPEEMELMYTIAEHERVDGFLWYTWLHSNYDQVLSDPEMEAQRQAVRHIYESHILHQPTE